MGLQAEENKSGLSRNTEETQKVFLEAVQKIKNEAREVGVLKDMRISKFSDVKASSQYLKRVLIDEKAYGI